MENPSWLKTRLGQRDRLALAWRKPGAGPDREDAVELAQPRASFRQGFRRKFTNLEDELAGGLVLPDEAKFLSIQFQF